MSERSHSLKTWPQFFAQIWIGTKTFESRFNDRDFRVGDTLELEEWEPESEKYTGRRITAHVTSLLRIEDPALHDNVVMSIRVIRQEEE